MAQITTGIRSILSHPLVYDLLQTIMGADKIRRYFIQQIVRPESKMRILDIGCGTGNIINYLPTDIEYIGYDPSDKYIKQARKSFADRGKFVVGYFDQEEAHKYEKFDIIICIGVLHHLDDEEARNLMELFVGALKESGRFCSLDCTFVEEQSRIARYLIEQDRGRNVRFYNEYISLAKQKFSSVKSELKHRKFIPYTHCSMSCSLNNELD